MTNALCQTRTGSALIQIKSGEFQRVRQHDHLSDRSAGLSDFVRKRPGAMSYFYLGQKSRPR